MTKNITAIEKLDKFNLYLNNFLATMAGISLFSMMFLIVGNSIVRKFYVPFIGTVEVVGWLAALTTAFAVGHTQRYKGHVVLDLLMEKCPLKIQAVVSVISEFNQYCIFHSRFLLLVFILLKLKTKWSRIGNFSYCILSIRYYVSNRFFRITIRLNC